MKKFILFLVSLSFCSYSLSQRCYGISSAAYAYHNGGNGYVLPSKSIVEEEIFNYHNHNIEQANYKNPVMISHKWGNKNITGSAEEIILQIGIATNKAASLHKIPPANLSLVVDISGSMSGDPIEKSKQAMKELVKQLRPTDQVSLVLFGDKVFIPFESKKIGNKKALLKAIEKIDIEGSTNIHLGMQAGYQQVASTFLKNGNNRVIVFTDAKANTGLINPNEILDSTGIYIKDIDLTFIGIGIGFDQNFARQIKSKLRGHLHYVQDIKEIEKLFKNEIEQFLVLPYGKEAKITIEIPEELELKKFYGYSPFYKENKIEIDLDDLQGGLTQIFLLKFNLNTGNKTSIGEVKYTLSFINQNGLDERLEARSNEIQLTTDMLNYNKLDDEDVKKNYCISYMANQLKQATINYESNNNEEMFYQKINQALKKINSEYQDLDDDLKYVYELLLNQTDPTKTAKKELILDDKF